MEGARNRDAMVVRGPDGRMSHMRLMWAEMCALDFGTCSCFAHLEAPDGRFI